LSEVRVFGAREILKRGSYQRMALLRKLVDSPDWADRVPTRNVATREKVRSERTRFSAPIALGRLDALGLFQEPAKPAASQRLLGHGLLAECLGEPREPEIARSIAAGCAVRLK
jgi:hypothetical protein